METHTELSERERRAQEIRERNEERIRRLKAMRSGAVSARQQKEAALADELAPIAKEVNHRLDAASKMEIRADDHRLAAALALKDAADKCKAAGVNFRKWSEENVKGHSYETVRKLLAVGKSDDPPKALADLRAMVARANKELRERRKAEQEELAELRQQKQAKQVIGGADPTEGGPTFNAPKFKIEGAVATEEYRRRHAEEHPAQPLLTGVDALKAAFNLLKASEKMAFTEWAALEIGAKLVTDFDEPPEEPKPARKLVRKK